MTNTILKKLHQLQAKVLQTVHHIQEIWHEVDNDNYCYASILCPNC